MTSRAGSEGLADERDAAHRLLRQPAEAADEALDPCGAGARLAGAAPAENEPGRPIVVVARRRELMVMQRRDLRQRELADILRPFKERRGRVRARGNTPQVVA
jgi:hypothetical protein